MSDRKELENKRKTRFARYDVFQEADKVQLSIEMPGVNRDNLEIRVDNNMLIIHGKKNHFNADGEYRVREIFEGDYHNEFTIDDTIDRDGIDASVKNGLVTIDMKIKESEKPRTIQISSK